MSVCKDFEGKHTLKWQGGNDIKEGSPDPSGNGQHTKELPDRGFQNTYTELRQGSKKAAMVVRNSMAYPQTLQKKTLVARAVMAAPLPESPVEAQLQEGGNEP